MKKGLSILLAIILLVTMIAPSFAAGEQDEGLQAAIVKAKALFNITEDYDQFEYSLNKSNDLTLYHLRWKSKDDKLGNINVSIDSQGLVKNYYSYTSSYSDSRTSLPKISKSEGLEIAKAFIEKVNPQVSDHVRYKASEAVLNVNSKNYYFRFVRTENDVPYAGNSMSVNVNNQTGKVQSYNCNWDTALDFPNTEDILSKDEVETVFENKVGLDLVYKFKYIDGKQEPYLVYTNLKNFQPIDAKTGEVLDHSPYAYYGGNNESAKTEASMDQANMERQQLSPEEKSAIESTANLLKEKEVESIARDVLDISDSYLLNQISLYKQGYAEGDFIYNLDFIKEDKEQGRLYISLGMDAKTGEIRNFHKMVPYHSEEKVKYDKEATIALAKDFISKMETEKAKDVAYATWNEPVIQPMAEKDLPKRMRLNFVRKFGDAYIKDNGFQIEVDRVTGQIVSYRYTWFKGDLPSADQALAKEEAYDILFGKMGLEQNYIARYDHAKSVSLPMTKPEIKLVYAVTQGKALDIDGLTGELLMYNGKPYKEKTIIDYKDIDDSYAEHEIKILAEFGIALPGNTFKPKANIKQWEMLYLLIKSKYPYVNLDLEKSDRDMEQLYRVALTNGIIKEGEKAPKDFVTRQEMAKYVIRTLKFDQVAMIEGIYTIPFKDSEKIEPKLKGYVAIAYGLNILNGHDGYFNPGHNLTREQSVIVIYNLLKGEQ